MVPYHIIVPYTKAVAPFVSPTTLRSRVGTNADARLACDMDGGVLDVSTCFVRRRVQSAIFGAVGRHPTRESCPCQQRSAVDSVPLCPARYAVGEKSTSLRHPWTLDKTKPSTSNGRNSLGLLPSHHPTKRQMRENFTCCPGTCCSE